MALSSDQQQQIDALRNEPQSTLRPTVPALEEILYQALPVLDHGFVRVVDYMGDDNAIVQAARVSYGKGTKKVNQDKGLIRYLMRHWHTTPFEMCEIKFHIKLPMFVARQWIRHRTANVNEYSARYSILDKEFYIPEPQHLAPQSSQNHQGRAGEPLEGEEAKRVLEILKDDAARSYDHYEELMNEDAQGNIKDENRRGLARELARMNLPVNAYTQWYWKIDLHNLMHFLMLRADSHAQYEIRAFADVMIDVLEKWVPHAYEAFRDYRLTAAHVSGPGLDVLKRMLSGENVTEENCGLNKREWNELLQALDLQKEKSEVAA